MAFLISEFLLKWHQHFMDIGSFQREQIFSFKGSAQQIRWNWNQQFHENFMRISPENFCIVTTAWLKAQQYGNTFVRWLWEVTLNHWIHHCCVWTFFVPCDFCGKPFFLLSSLVLRLPSYQTSLVPNKWNNLNMYDYLEKMSKYNGKYGNFKHLINSLLIH